MELVFRDDAYAKECEATVVSVDGNAVRLDRTVFYPMGGGQPGDAGELLSSDGQSFAVADTVKGESHEDVVHLLNDGAEVPAVGTKVLARIDWERRYRLMRMHSCMHILCSLIEGEVTGGQVGDPKSRLDFNLPDTKLDKDALNAELNRLIAEDHEVRPKWISQEELDEKPELVRTMSVKPPRTGGSVRLLEIEGVDLQPCGGTHVQRTGEIGKVRIGKIENKGRQNRRVNILFDE